MQGGRQRGSARRNREVGRALEGGAAENVAGTAKNGLTDEGRGDHLIVEDDRERFAEILLRPWANLRAPEVLNRKLTTGSLVR